MSKLTDLQGQLEDRRTKLAAVFAQAGPDRDMAKVTSLDGDTTAKVEGIRSLDAEINDLADQVKAAQQEQSDLAAIAGRTAAMSEPVRGAIHPTTGAERREQAQAAKTLGQAFIESAAYKGRPTGMGYGPQSTLDIGATTFQRTAGWAPESLRTGVVVDKITRPIQVHDLFAPGSTNSASVVYMEETTFTNNAAERAEAGPYVASALALTQRTVPVETVGTSIPVTDEQLADVAQAQSYVEARVQFMVLQRVDDQLINGDGATPNIRGILNASGLQTQAKGADSVPAAIRKAMTKVRVGGRAFPSAAIIHSNDWQDVQLLTTADGIFIFGSPQDPGVNRIWGLTVVECESIAEGTAIVGDFSPVMAQLYARSGMDVQIGFVNDDFLNGMQTIRAGLRLAAVYYRGQAMCTVTGI